MAYGIKYRFRTESVHGITYEVRLLENGYRGTVTTRPLGKAPVIRMQESDPFRPTSCDLVLECQTDGEYVDLYTTDVLQYKVEVYHKKSSSSFFLLWQGYVATELYSEPDIAPPYDVKITDVERDSLDYKVAISVKSGDKECSYEERQVNVTKENCKDQTTEGLQNYDAQRNSQDTLAIRGTIVNAVGLDEFELCIKEIIEL
jgi:hypothetical protein